MEVISNILAQNNGGNCGIVGYSKDSFTATGSKNSEANINLGSLATNGVIAPNSNSDAIDYIPAGTNGCATTMAVIKSASRGPEAWMQNARWARMKL